MEHGNGTRKKFWERSKANCDVTPFNPKTVGSSGAIAKRRLSAFIVFIENSSTYINLPLNNHHHPQKRLSSA
jgi:hypothetical protein